MWLTNHDERTAASMPSIKAHNAVVVHAMTEGVTPVPLRFGQWLATEQEARSVLSQRDGQWNALLQRFAGKVEFGIRVFRRDMAGDTIASDTEEDGSVSSAAQAVSKSGTAYMASLAKRYGGSDELRARILAALKTATGDVVAEESVESLRTPHGVMTVAHLVRVAEAAAYREAVEKAESRMPEVRLLSTGPWPPYSFVS